MEKVTIIVKTISYDLWWGIYGISYKSLWEDIEFFYEDGERIGSGCLNTKSHMRPSLEDLKNNPKEKEFVLAIEKYLADDKCHYWFYYTSEPMDSEEFYEVPYNAPKNDKGIKPCFIDIWHPDERIDLSTIETGTKHFAANFLGITDCIVKIEGKVSYEEALGSFKENEAIFGGSEPVQATFSDELIDELSTQWEKPKEEVLNELHASVKGYPRNISLWEFIEKQFSKIKYSFLNYWR
ncbi:MAG: hypothetical protein AB8B69_03995 [Chitinophagales bacterium]